MCTQPLWAWPADPLAPNRRVVFNPARSYQGAVPFKVPCGKCADCRFARAGDWAVRCMHEAQMHEVSSWVTATYADEFLPDDYSVHREELQRFNKALRYRFGEFRFFACGENGGRYGRPHYHQICFGLDFPDKVPIGQSGAGHLLYHSPRLDEAWGKGMCKIGAVTLQSAGYTARYEQKKLAADDAGETWVHPVTGVLCKVAPPFLQMSRAPGIGSTWFDRFAGDVFPSDFVMVDGRKCRVPAYYLAKLEEREQREIKASRRRAAEVHAANNTESRLMVRHEAGRLRMERMARDFDGMPS